MANEWFQSLKNLSEENPNPVFSVSKEKLVLHTNPACDKVLQDWRLDNGKPAPEDLRELIYSAFESTHPQNKDLSFAGYLFNFEVIPFLGSGSDFALVHGSISESSSKDIERFNDFRFSEEKNHLLVTNALDGIITIDDRGLMQSFNPAAEKIFGYSAGEIIGKNISLLMPEPDSSQHDSYMENYYKTGQAKILGMPREVTALKKGGFPFPLEINISEMTWKERRVFVGIVRDITQRRQIEEKLKRSSVSDGLTGIGNRRLFDETLNKEWKRAMRDQFSLSLILMDIDYFKLYNDNYGHQEGDDCLRQVANALAKVVQRPADLVARYGGEEFAVILPETTSEGALRLAESIRSSIEGLKIEHCKSPVSYITVSAGVSTLIPERGSSFEQLVSIADNALYRAKEKGRNQVNATGG